MIEKLKEMFYLLAAVFLLTPPLLAQTTQVNPGMNGSYYTYTTNADGSRSHSEIDPGMNGSYYIHTTHRDGETSESEVNPGMNGSYYIHTTVPYTPFIPDSETRESDRMDREQESIARQDREAERERRDNERAADQSLSDIVREQGAERRELAAEQRAIASEPIHDYYAPRVYPVVPPSAPGTARRRHAQQRVTDPRTIHLKVGMSASASKSQWDSIAYLEQERQKIQFTNPLLARQIADREHRLRHPSQSDNLDRLAQQMISDGSMPDMPVHQVRKP